MAGTLVISTLSDGTNSTSSTNCIQGSAKAWVNFNGSTAAIRASYNVSSVIRSGTGRYQINFTTAMPDANYTYTFGGQPSSDTIAGYKTDYNQTNTSAALFMQVGSASATADFTTVCASVFR